MSYKFKKTDKISEDIALAEKLCKELRSGNKGAIVEVYNANHLFFLNFIRKRLYESKTLEPEDVFASFWEKLMDGEVFCRYEGYATLRSYLCSILYKHICDTNRTIERDRKIFTPDNEIEESPDRSPKNPEEEAIESESKQKEIVKRELVLKVRSKLSGFLPKDEAYIRMRYFEDLKFKDMAMRELGKGTDEKKIKKKTDAIRKQFTRPRTGSMARFRVILERLMKEENLSIEDILDQE